MGKGMERGKRKSRGGGEGTREERGVSSCLGTPATCLCGTLESQGIRELHSWAQQSSRWDGRERFRELVPVFGPHPQLSPTHTSTPAHMYTPTYMYTPHIQMHTHTCTHTHTYPCRCVHAGCRCAHTHAHTYTLKCTHVHIHADIHIHTPVHALMHVIKTFSDILRNSKMAQ